MSMQPAEILLVEDNPDDEALALIALRENNLAGRVDVVRDGAEALQYLAACGLNAPLSKTLPPVILLDLKLPKVSGLEVLKFIKSNPGLARVPVVVLTSSREHRDILESYRLGVNSYIVKPVTFERFVESVREIGRYWLLFNQPPIAEAAP